MTKKRVNDILHNSLNVSLGSYKKLPEGYSLDDNDWQLVYLAKIEYQLRRLNDLLHCGNAVAIPKILRAIEKNTKKRPRKKVKK